MRLVDWTPPTLSEPLEDTPIITRAWFVVDATGTIWLGSGRKERPERLEAMNAVDGLHWEEFGIVKVE